MNENEIRILRADPKKFLRHFLGDKDPYSSVPEILVPEPFINTVRSNPSTYVERVDATVLCDIEGTRLKPDHERTREWREECARISPAVVGVQDTSSTVLNMTLYVRQRGERLAYVEWNGRRVAGLDGAYLVGANTAAAYLGLRSGKVFFHEACDSGQAGVYMMMRRRFDRKIGFGNTWQGSHEVHAFLLEELNRFRRTV